ncbi:MAG TPA: nitronate monooxygenase [Sneathiellales bacterium]|jgi:NAD(P)H-dependent flavin oxidoreductase YrpB (nitropropane dioxygenase family)|nr:nitronate monooxygenase [Sneathiellales bacterium]
MKSPICERFGIEFPLMAFTHCRDVVVEVSKAGGMGVLGATGMSPAELETELAWIDEHIEGHPYGVDLLIPNKMLGKDETPSTDEMVALVPKSHTDFTNSILERYQIDNAEIDDETRARFASFGDNMRTGGAQALLDVAFAHPISMIVNALGVPPDYMLKRGKDNGVAVGALVGAKEHAIRQVQAGVDVLVVAGSEGGGHCGTVTTMVLIPEVHEAIQPFGDVPILAAGGIATGRQMAAAMTMGAAGVWCASVWLTTVEAETSEPVKAKMLAAGSADTVRSKSRTGKFSRQLRSPWTDAWEAPDAPEPLPMPLQTIVSGPPLAKVDKLSEGGHPGAQQLATYWVGQGVGLMHDSMSVRAVVNDFREDFVDAYERLTGFLEE